jgi:uncharacterized membrane protein
LKKSWQPANTKEEIMRTSMTLFSAIFCLLIAGPSYAVDSYVLLDLGTMGNDQASANSINNRGVIVGITASTSGSSGFKWEPSRQSRIDFHGPLGRATILPFLPPDPAERVDIMPESINDKNEIIGRVESYSPGAVPLAVMWDGDCNPDTIWENGRGVDINNNAHALVSDGNAINSFDSILINEAGWTSIIDTGHDSIPFAINNKDQVVGQIIERAAGGYGYMYAYIWEDARITDLNVFNPDPEWMTLLQAVDINELGQVIGVLEIANPDGSFDYSSFLVSGKQAYDIGFKGARAINDNGVIVGSHFLYANNQYVDGAGVLHRTGGRLYDLNRLIRYKYRWSCRRHWYVKKQRCSLEEIEYDLLYARDINNSGQIVGNAVIDGNVHAVLLLPVRASGFARPTRFSFFDTLPE